MATSSFLSFAYCDMLSRSTLSFMQYVQWECMLSHESDGF